MRLLIALLIITLAVSTLTCDASAAALQFWHTWPHAAQTVHALAARYTKQTGVAIQIRVMPTASRMTWGSSGGPDIAGLYRPTKRDIEYMAGKRLIQDIRADMGRGWYAIFWPGLLETFSIRDSGGTGIYGVPLTGQMHVFVYNKQLFHKAGIGVPGSWSELMAASRKLRRIGAEPYAGGFGSDTPPLAAVYEYSYLGLHLLSQTYFGHYAYTAPEWIAYLRLYSEMKSYGFTDPTSAKATETAAIKSLLDGRVAMVFADASFESIRGKYKPAFTAWGLFGAPVDSRARFLPRLPGGVVEGLVINSHSARKTQAIAFAKWLTQYAQQLAFAGGSSSIPAMTVASNSGQLSARLRPFAKVGMNDLAIDMRIYERPSVLTTFYSGVRGILAGSDTPSSVARRTKATKAR